jgi:hypothetical protein
MTITPTGQSIIKSKEDGQRYAIQADELDWIQISSDERQMGLEIEYLGEIEHPELGRLSWSVREYPVGIINKSDEDINGHTLEENFTFDPHSKNNEDWNDFNDHDELDILSDDQLRALPHVNQEEYIINWFHSQFLDPAEETPYNGREGGYLYIYGGPYDAREEIEEKFGNVVDESVIKSAVEEIESDGTIEWAPSSSHPDQLRAAEEYYESLKSQTLEEMRILLESGAKINLESPAARSAAEELNKSAQNLIAAVDARQPAHGGIGHNGPALDDEGNPLPADFEYEVRETSVRLSVQMEAASPDPTSVIEAVTRLQRFRAWLKPRINLAADEFSKELGKRAATAVVAVGTIVLASILPGLDTTIAAALNWLQAILF